jgi:hypothetical protein
VVVYTRTRNDFATSQQAADGAAEFPIYFGPDITSLRRLEPREASDLPPSLPDELAATILAIAVPGHNR